MSKRRRHQRRDFLAREIPPEGQVAPPPPPKGSRTRVAAILILFAVTFASLRVGSYIQMSATWDEPAHLTAGYAALAHGDHRIDPSHPPFGRMWAALPLLFMSDVSMDLSYVDRVPEYAWLATNHPTTFARSFLYQMNDADRLLYPARFMIVLLAIGAGCILFFWCREWLGLRAAIIALALYTFEPNISAHSALVTTDFPATAFFFATAYFLWKVCRGGGPWYVAGLAACFALAIVTKYSGILLIPIVGLLLLLATRAKQLTTARALKLAGVLAVTTFAVIWMVYGFRDAPSADPSWRFTLSEGVDVRALAPRIAALTTLVDSFHLLPNAFTQGILYFSVANWNSSYLLGSIAETGRWYYFPVAMAVKTPISLIILVLLGGLVYARHRRILGALNESFVLVPAAVYLGLSIFSGINIGLRHVLPVYPFLIIIGAAAADWLVGSRKRVGQVVIAGLALRWAWSFVAIYPHHLSFFNAIAGGPRGGVEYLADSNLDWGQDLKRLRGWMQQQGIEEINLAYFGQAEPAYYGINAHPIPGTDIGRPSKPRLPGFLAVSATVMTGVYLPPPFDQLYRGFSQLKPVAEIGKTIKVYWVEKWPEEDLTLTEGSADGALASEFDLAGKLSELNWFDHAIVHYERYLEARPNDARAWAGHGLATVLAGDVEAGLASLRKAVSFDPEDPAVRGTLAAALLQSGSPKEALIQTGHATRLAPDNPMLADLHGVALEASGRIREAIAQFDRALSIMPDYEPARKHAEDARRALSTARGEGG